MVRLCVLVELSRKVLMELCCLGLWLCSDASAEILVNHEMLRERELAVGFQAQSDHHEWMGRVSLTR